MESEVESLRSGGQFDSEDVELVQTNGHNNADDAEFWDHMMENLNKNNQSNPETSAERDEEDFKDSTSELEDLSFETEEGEEVLKRREFATGECNLLMIPIFRPRGS